MSITNDLVIVETEDRTVRDPEKVYDGSTVPQNAEELRRINAT